MTDNDFADPWGLPSTPEPGDDTAPDAPVEPSPEPDAPPTQSTSEPSTPEPPAAEPPAPEPPLQAEPDVEEPPSRVEEEVMVEPDPIDIVSQPDLVQETPAPPPSSSGPYSQVLAAASGLFGRSTTPKPAESDVDMTDEETDSIDDPDAPVGAMSEESVADVQADEPGLADDFVDVTVEDATPEELDEAMAVDEVEDALASLETDSPAVDLDTPESDESADLPTAETVSVEEIAAMASQLKVEAPEPFEVSFTTETDEPAEPESVADADDLGVGISEVEAAVADVDAVLEADTGFDTDIPDISIDMDSAPSVIEQLGEEMEEMAESDAGGFDVGAVFHSGEETPEEPDPLDLGVEALDDVTVDSDAISESIDEITSPSSRDLASIFGEVATGPTEELPEPETDAPAMGDSFADTDLAGGEDATDDALPADVTEDEIPAIEALVEDAVESADPVSFDESDADTEDEPEHLDADDEESPEDDDSQVMEDAPAALAGAAVAESKDSDAAPARFVDSGEVEWGARWHESAQGWVEDADGQATWRPIVTTASTLSEWEVDTYLGIVVGDSPVSTAAPMDTAMALSRQHAIRLMVDEALSRGAHAVIGVHVTVAEVGSVALATATGTAVTLKPGDA